MFGQLVDCILVTSFNLTHTWGGHNGYSVCLGNGFTLELFQSHGGRWWCYSGNAGSQGSVAGGSREANLSEEAARAAVILWLVSKRAF